MSRTPRHQISVARSEAGASFRIAPSIFSPSILASWILARWILVCATTLGQACVLPTGATAAGTIDFVRDVRPIFQSHCYRCHGETKQKSGLRLDIRSEAFKGGDNYGFAIVAGETDESTIIELVRSDDEDTRMPPDAEPLSESQIKTLVNWIDQGAPWPDGVDLAKLADRTDHWSFKPLTRPEPPVVEGDVWSRTDMDRFVLAQLHRRDLEPSPDASRSVWIRRVYLDLIGLPPRPDQVRSFMLDQSEDAYHHVVERLLGSPRYGERWAQHWLDVVRYADTDGFEVNTERANAWPYRDYVISAFNLDTPYDQFIREQLIGDLLQQDAATGFLVTAAALLPGQIGQDDQSKRQARQDELAEILINTGEAFLGLSLGCARCHDHKFDPITQHDYYSMQAFFAGVRYGERPIQTPDAKQQRQRIGSMRSRILRINQMLDGLEPLARVDPPKNGDGRRAAVNAKRNVDRFEPVTASSIRFTIKNTNNREPCLDELEVYDTEGNNVALASTGTKATASGSAPVSKHHKLEHIHDGKYGNAHSWMSSEVGGGWIELTFKQPRVIGRVVWGRDRLEKYTDRLAVEYAIEIDVDRASRRLVASSADRTAFAEEKPQAVSIATFGLSAKQAAQAKKLLTERQAIQKSIALATNAQKVFAGKFSTPDITQLLSRGDPEQPLQEVAPAVIAALGKAAAEQDADDRQRRQILANWIASPDNPLTARVMVNRIWQWHFGVGLVETASDLGRSGAKPTHPELLDWLAQEFIGSGWSIKSLHRTIVLSATYRQSSQVDKSKQQTDADSRSLWRFPSRRLEAESIRDSMLAVSGRLNLQSGGPGFNLFKSRGGLNGFPPIESFSDAGRRRMIYAHKVRMEREVVFGAFDCPDAGQTMPRRRQSTTPIQALNLFNSQFTIDEALALAQRVNDEAGDDASDQVQHVFQIAFGRQASPQELDETVRIVKSHGLETVCRAILNSNEFLFMP